MSGLPTILRPRGGKLDAQGLRAYCEQRAAKGEAAQLYEPLLDLVEQLSDATPEIGVGSPDKPTTTPESTSTP